MKRVGKGKNKNKKHAREKKQEKSSLVEFIIEKESEFGLVLLYIIHWWLLNKNKGERGVSFVHSFIHLFIYLFIYLFINMRVPARGSDLFMRFHRPQTALKE